MANRRGKVETVTGFLFLSSKITVDGDCSHECKRYLLLGRKAMTNLDSILKSRDITLLTNICIITCLVFPVVLYRCESWTIRNGEHWRIDAFKLWSWRRLLGVPWTARRSNQSILEGNQPWIFIGRTDGEGEDPFFGHLMQRADSSDKRPSCWKRLKSEREEGGGVSWLDSIADSVDMSLSKFWETVRNREAWHAAVDGVTKSHT